MSYTMRPLKTPDIFKMSKILKAMKLRASDINIKEGMTQTEAGIAIILAGLENLHLAEKEISEFMGSLVGLSEEEFNELPIEETLKIIAMFKEQKGIINFLESAGKLTT